MLRKILAISLLLCLCVSCDENITSPVPLAKVSLKFSLVYDKQSYDNLNKGALHYVIANQETIRPLKETDFFGCNGLLLIVNINNQTTFPVDIKAYDLYCPNDGATISPDNPVDTETATCPKCKEQYYVGDGGYPLKGSKYRLKSYNVYYNETTNVYIVTN